MIGTICAGLLALALEAVPVDPFPVFTSPGMTMAVSGFCDDCMIKAPKPSVIAIFGNRIDDREWWDVDYRCAIVTSRGNKHGWLIDRKDNTAVRVEGQTLPDWCTEP